MKCPNTRLHCLNLLVYLLDDGADLCIALVNLLLQRLSVTLESSIFSLNHFLERLQVVGLLALKAAWSTIFFHPYALDDSFNG